MSSSQLFKPLKVGRNTLSHRVVLPPLTRYRATKKTHVPFAPLVSNYYKQRSSRPRTLLITEATLVSAQSGGDDHVPGIWSESQIAAWKEVCFHHLHTFYNLCTDLGFRSQRPYMPMAHLSTSKCGPLAGAQNPRYSRLKDSLSSLHPPSLCIPRTAPHGR